MALRFSLSVLEVVRIEQYSGPLQRDRSHPSCLLTVFFICTATPDYAGLERRTHHEIEVFFATTFLSIGTYLFVGRYQLPITTQPDESMPAYSI
jgi:hypothetical protein